MILAQVIPRGVHPLQSACPMVHVLINSTADAGVAIDNGDSYGTVETIHFETF